MPRSKIEQRDALDIARKIGADLKPDGKHQKAILWHDGKLILRFGIRHGRRTGQGHLVGANHDLRLNATKVLELARCAMTKNDYIDHLKSKGLI